MKSKVKFDLIDGINPAIVGYISKDTDDLRDKVAKMFKDDIGDIFNLLIVDFSYLDNGDNMMFIKPVKYTSMHRLASQVGYLLRELADRSEDVLEAEALKTLWEETTNKLREILEDRRLKQFSSKSVN